MNKAVIWAVVVVVVLCAIIQHTEGKNAVKKRSLKPAAKVDMSKVRHAIRANLDRKKRSTNTAVESHFRSRRSARKEMMADISEKVKTFVPRVKRHAGSVSADAAAGSRRRKRSSATELRENVMESLANLKNSLNRNSNQGNRINKRSAQKLNTPMKRK